MKEAALVLFFKRPQLGVGKQRLAATVGRADACVIAEHLLECALEDAALWHGTVVFAVAESDDLRWAETEIAPRFQHKNSVILAQGAGNLGQRLNHVDRALRSAGLHSLYYIGSDAPILDAAFYRSAEQALEQSDCVFATSDDGGVTLMANRKPWPDLSGLPWSTEQLYHSLSHCCLAAGLSEQTVEGRYDVDIFENLLALRQDLKQDMRPARQALCKQIDRLASLYV